MLLPQFFPLHWIEEDFDIAHVEIAPDIGLGIVERDGSGTYQFLGNSAVQGSGAVLGITLAQAIDNLRTIPSGQLTTAHCYGGAEGMIHSDTDNFGAARLTIAKIRAMIEADCGSDCWIGIPCRDIAYFWSRSQSDARRAQNEHEVRSVWEQDDYNLSPTPISFRKFSSVLKELSV